MIARHCALARYLAERLSGKPGIEVLNEVVANQVAIACASDALTEEVLRRVQARGRAYPSHGVWQGRKIIRASIINHATDRADIDLLVAELLSALRDLG